MTRSTTILILLAGVLLLPVSDVALAQRPGSDPEIEALQDRIDAAGYSWTARRNWTTDLSEEAWQQILGLRVPPDVAKRFAALRPGDFRVAKDLPSSWDWRDYDAVTPVKNQGSCGSCWDFAGVGALECVLKMHEGIVYDLSEQQVLSCATPGTGCSGGWYGWAWSYQRDHGAANESCMPYQANDDVPCADASCTKVATAGPWIDIPNDVNCIKTALLTSPVATSFHVYNDFRSYGSGCYENPGSDSPNHAVVIIGWDDAMCGGQGAWLVKNSWGASWGSLGGYFWIRYGSASIGTMTQQVFYDPGDLIVYKDHGMTDAPGDGDGRADPGETVSLPVVLRNGIIAPSRTGIQAELATSSELVTVTQGASAYGSLAAGASGTGTPAFGFEVSEFAPAGAVVEFVLSVTADGGYAGLDTFEVTLGPVPILFVDDDEGETTETYFERALADNGYVYEKWVEDLDGDVPLSELERYVVTVWTTGWGGGLATDNRNTLTSFLNGGGRLFLSGEDIGWYLNYEGDPAKIQFFNNYLHADYVADDSGYRSLAGVAGDPIGGGLSLTLNGVGSAMNQFYPSEINPRAGASGIFEYAAGHEGALRFGTGHREVLLAFGLEGVTTTAMQDTILRRGLEWLAEGNWPDTGQPEVELLSPNGGENFVAGTPCDITWNASDDVGVTSIDILRSFDSGVTFTQTVATGEPNDGSFTWVVPEGEDDTSRIRIIARDAAGLAWYDDSDADFTTGPTVGVRDGAGIRPFALDQNAPNPFNPATRIAYSIAGSSWVDLSIYDPSGRQVRRLLAARQGAGSHVALWDGRTDDGAPAASGTYFYRLAVDGRELTRRMILLK